MTIKEKKFGYFVYDFDCSSKDYKEPFVNPGNPKKIVTIYENGRVQLSIERDKLGKNDKRKGNTEFMKDSLVHREEIYMLPLLNKFSKNDYCLSKEFKKK